jgi:hypothetical protein
MQRRATLRRGEGLAKRRVQHNHELLVLIDQRLDLLCCSMEQNFVAGDDFFEFGKQLVLAGDAVANAHAATYKPAREIAD